jgi:hypothetical protein
MLERSFAAVPEQVFTAVGGADGVITIANTSLFKVGQQVIVSGIGLPNLEVEVKQVLSPTTLVVGDPTGSKYARTDLSSYNIGARVFANEQKRPSIPAEELNRAIYEEEPTVGSRVVLVDASGNKYSNTNPLPTSASVSVGDITIGVADQGVPNTIANAWPVKVTDGLDSLGINPDGSINVKQQASTSNCTNVASSATNVMLLAANVNRIGATIFNDSTQILYVKLGAVASTTSYTLQMGSKAYYEVPFGYTGQIDGFWVSADGFARVGELA